MIKRGKRVSIALGSAVAGLLLVAGPLTMVSGAQTSSDKPAATGSRSSSAGTAVSVAPGAWGGASVACPAGRILSGGGASTSAFDIELTDTRPNGNGWFVGGRNHGTTAQTITAWAVCLALS
jgi:hypothetical protein